MPDWSTSRQNQKPPGSERPSEEDTARRVRLWKEKVSHFNFTSKIPLFLSCYYFHTEYKLSITCFRPDSKPYQSTPKKKKFSAWSLVSFSVYKTSYYSKGERNKAERLKSRNDQLHPFKWVSLPLLIMGLPRLVSYLSLLIITDHDSRVKILYLMLLFDYTLLSLLLNICMVTACQV